MDPTLIIAILVAIVFLVIGVLLGKQLGRTQANAKWEMQIPKIRADATKRSRAVLGGKISEQLAPFLPGFKYQSSEVRFLGSPIDFVVFKGLDHKEVEEIIFVEVKTGKSQLSATERSVWQSIEAGKVRWERYDATTKE